MSSKRFLGILIILLALAFLSVSVFVLINYWPQISSSSGSDNGKDHGYYKELPEFTFWLTEDPYKYNRLPDTPLSSPIEVKYIERNIIDNKPDAYTQVISYTFTTIPNSLKLYLIIPSGVHNAIKLTPGETYQIDYYILFGWPNQYRLVINKGEGVSFIGNFGWSPDIWLNPDNTTLFQVNKIGILDNNYIDGESSDFWERKTNTEIEFTLNENSVILHQGESSTLGDYDITLLIAREIQYKPGWYDVGQNCISYVISKIAN